jgi:PHD/YefM family antitoxin component YafN of YafNO toxin-antitoxin module
MEVTTYSSFRASLKKKLDKITNDHDILIVNRKGNKDVVVMSLKGKPPTNYILRGSKSVSWLTE